MMAAVQANPTNPRTQSASAFATFTDVSTLRIQRTLPGPIERVWAYLTDGELRRQWLASGEMDLKPGASFELVWRNDELSESDDRAPNGTSGEHRATCRILEVDPPRKLKYEWPQAGEVTFELAPEGKRVLLTVTHHRLTDRRLLTMVGPGWHAHLDILVALLEGTAPPSFWRGWTSLRPEYERRIPE